MISKPQAMPNPKNESWIAPNNPRQIPLNALMRSAIGTERPNNVGKQTANRRTKNPIPFQAIRLKTHPNISPSHGGELISVLVRKRNKTNSRETTCHTKS